MHVLQRILAQPEARLDTLQRHGGERCLFVRGLLPAAKPAAKPAAMAAMAAARHSQRHGALVDLRLLGMGRQNHGEGLYT